MRIDPKHISPDMTDDTELAAETSARQSADSSLQSQIDTINSQIGNPEFVFVNEKADFPTPSAGVITLASNTTYYVTKAIDLTGDRLVASQNTAILGSSSKNCSLVSTGLSSATAMITSNWSLPVRNITLTHGTTIDLDASANANQKLEWFDVTFESCATVGAIKGYSDVIMTDSILSASANMSFDGTFDTIGFDKCLFSGINGQKTLDFLSTLTINRRIRIIYSAFITSGTATSINVDASATIPVESYILDTVDFSGGATYLTGVQYTDNKALFVNCKGINNSSEIGQMYMSGNATVTTIATANTFVKAAGTTTANTINQKFTHTSNRLTFTGGITRFFRVNAIATASSSNGNIVSVAIAKNGTVITESESKAAIPGNNKVENLKSHALVELTSTDYIEVFVANDSTNDITVEQLNVIIEALN